MANFCVNKDVDLREISAFSLSNDEWPQALLSIYESIYTVDCQKMLRLMKSKGIEPQGKRHIPDAVVCYSTAIRPFLVYLDNWRVSQNCDQLSISENVK